MTEESTNGREYEIPENERIDEEIPESERTAEGESLAAEFAALGKRFGEALNHAWNSEERYRLQEDLKEGLDRFTKEVDKAVKDLRKTEAAQKAETSAQQAAQDVKSGKVGSELRRATVTGLRALSDALDSMANSFTPYEDEGEVAEEPYEEAPPEDPQI